MITVMDAYFKLVRQNDVIPGLELQSYLSQAAFCLPFHPKGSDLFGEGLVEIFQLNESYNS